MGRLLRISIYALIILVLYYLMTAIIKTYTDKNKIESESGSNTNIDLNDTYTDTLAEISLDTSNTISNEEIVDGNIDYDAVDEKIKSLQGNENTIVTKKQPEKMIDSQAKTDKNTKPTKKTENQPIKNTPATKVKVKAKEKPAEKPNYNEVGAGGQFIVMAGSYLLRENAEKMVKKLKSMGYSNAKVMVFSSSQYHSVVAAQLASQIKALEASADLKRKGIDSFVKTK